MTGSDAMAGAARLVLVDGAVLLHPEPAVFEAILAGWRMQQESRLLAFPTIDSRDKTLRRFQEFTGDYPWRWGPGDIEEWSVSLRTRGLWEALRPYHTSVYVNFLMDEGEDGIRRAYGDAKYQRLKALKNTYDPENFFRLNQNIPPG